MTIKNSKVKLCKRIIELAIFSKPSLKVSEIEALKKWLAGMYQNRSQNRLEVKKQVDRWITPLHRKIGIKPYIGPIYRSVVLPLKSAKNLVDNQYILLDNRYAESWSTDPKVAMLPWFLQPTESNEIGVMVSLSKPIKDSTIFDFMEFEKLYKTDKTARTVLQKLKESPGCELVLKSQSTKYSVQDIELVVFDTSIKTLGSVELKIRENLIGSSIDYEVFKPMKGKFKPVAVDLDSMQNHKWKKTPKRFCI